ncbi:MULTISPECIES: AAA family ATPase [Streptomyces]|uniref:MoxR family ATPase n=1 Tax=Streptomyces malaysiensis subsp. samsunensis TaxID=459658 RepID=A0A9X2RQW1_STRMQ|nr:MULTISPECIES: MoxR family ATPase [Streptomyces]MCD9593361.1 MoxR family ATPase [Streptomyces sp. 8ZJF_21]MCQ8827547.1 MoxR family ATPase [Streptomyces samsunensis]
MAQDWRLFQGGATDPHEVETWPTAPPWRRFGDDARRRDEERGLPYLISDEDRDVVNMALHLHRPLLVTGRPGTGKSTLAHAIARELMLGEVLHWPVNSRSTLTEGLYSYDAVGRLREASLKRRADETAESEPDIGDYLRLGALGTALLPADRPRVLLVDELDKGDVDLPNDLLTVFEEGEFEIPELARLGEDRTIEVQIAGSREKAAITGGWVSCGVFPVVVITSNGEREFPPAFLRRCVRLDLKQPDERQLRQIVTMHLGEEVGARAQELIADFVTRRNERELATDQLLNAVRLRSSGVRVDQDVLDKLFRSLNEVDAQ